MKIKILSVFTNLSFCLKLICGLVVNPQREGTENVQHDDKRGFPIVFTPSTLFFPFQVTSRNLYLDDCILTYQNNDLVIEITQRSVILTEKTIKIQHLEHTKNHIYFFKSNACMWQVHLESES